MKARFLNLMLVLFLGISVSMLTSCKKDEDKDTDPTTTDSDTDAVSDNDDAETEFSEIFNYVDEESSENSSTGRYAGGPRFPCVDTVIFSKNNDTNNLIRILTFMFDSTKVCRDGKMRQGKIVASIKNGKYKKPGSEVTVTLEGFKVKYANATRWIKIEGTKVIKNQSDPLKLNERKVNVVVTGGKLYITADSIISWASDRTRTVTFDSTDVTMSMFGSASGVSRKGVAYTATIDAASPLVRKKSCGRQFVSGTIVLKLTGKPERSIDYGDGTCDKVATVTISGKTFTFKIR